jgi:hypothetical protein
MMIEVEGTDGLILRARVRSSLLSTLQELWNTQDMPLPTDQTLKQNVHE